MRSNARFVLAAARHARNCTALLLPFFIPLDAHTAPPLRAVGRYRAWIRWDFQRLQDRPREAASGDIVAITQSGYPTHMSIGVKFLDVFHRVRYEHRGKTGEELARYHNIPRVSLLAFDDGSPFRLAAEPLQGPPGPVREIEAFTPENWEMESFTDVLPSKPFGTHLYFRKAGFSEQVIPRGEYRLAASMRLSLSFPDGRQDAMEITTRPLRLVVRANTYGDDHYRKWLLFGMRTLARRKDGSEPMRGLLRAVKTHSTKNGVALPPDSVGTYCYRGGLWEDAYAPLPQYLRDVPGTHRRDNPARVNQRREELREVCTRLGRQYALPE